MSCACIGHPTNCYNHPTDCGCTKRQAEIAAMPEERQFLPSDFIKFATFTPLQEKVYELGVCAKCHKKTMRFIHAGAGMAFWQCIRCKIIAVLADSAPESRDV